MSRRGDRTRVLLVARSGERSFPSAAGLEVVEVVTHVIEPVAVDPGMLKESFDLAIVTSRAAIERLAAQGLDAGSVAERWIAVGPATARRTGKLLGVEAEEGGGSVRRILARLPADLSGTRVLLPRGHDANEELPEELAARGAEVVRLVLYRKVPAPCGGSVESVVARRTPAVFCATSPAAARWLFGCASAQAVETLRRLPAVVLGEPTRSALLEHGVSRIHLAQPPTFEAAARVAAELAAGRDLAARKRRA